jgi:hypothetical protein
LPGKRFLELQPVTKGKIMTRTQSILATVATVLTLTAGSAMASDPVQETAVQEGTELRTQLKTASMKQEKLQLRLNEQALLQDRTLAAQTGSPSMAQKQIRTRTQARVQTRTQAHTQAEQRFVGAGGAGAGLGQGGMGRR